MWDVGLGVASKICFMHCVQRGRLHVLGVCVAGSLGVENHVSCAVYVNLHIWACGSYRCWFLGVPSKLGITGWLPWPSCDLVDLGESLGLDLGMALSVVGAQDCPF